MGGVTLIVQKPHFARQMWEARYALPRRRLQVNVADRGGSQGDRTLDSNNRPMIFKAMGPGDTVWTMCQYRKEEGLGWRCIPHGQISCSSDGP